MKCKNCNRDLLFTIGTLRNFCSYDCRKEHRKNQQNQWDRKFRHYRQGDTSNMPESDITSADKQKEILGQKVGSETYKSYGGKKWYIFVKKHCCNFKVRQEEGYCITLSAPYISFKKPCNQCKLGIVLRHRELINKH